MASIVPLRAESRILGVSNLYNLEAVFKRKNAKFRYAKSNIKEYLFRIKKVTAN